MKRYFIILSLLVIALAACQKDSVKPDRYISVTYHGNGGLTPEGNSSVKYTYLSNECQAISNCFINGDKVFSKWNNKSDGSGYNNYQQGYTIHGYQEDIDLYAIWINQYTINYHANGGSGTMNPQYVIEGDMATLRANSFTKSGYVFCGWNTKSDGSGTAYNNQASITPHNNVDLYAQWKQKSSNCTLYHENYSTDNTWVWGTWSSTNYNYCFGTNSNGYTACAEYVSNSGTKIITELVMSYAIGGSSGNVKIAFCNKTADGPGTPIKEFTIPMSTLYQHAINYGNYQYSNYHATVLITNFSEFGVTGDYYVVVYYSGIYSRFHILATLDGVYSTNTAYCNNGSTWQRLGSRTLSLGLKPRMCIGSGGKTDGEDDIIVMPMPYEGPSQGFGVEIE